MRDFNITVRRTTWHMEDIEEYEKALEEKLKALEGSWEIRDALANSELISKMKEAITTELLYCEFYRTYIEKNKVLRFFNQWDFTKKEDIKYKYREPEGAQWTKTNGRIKATILVAEREKNTKIQLSYENDYPNLKFLPSQYGSLKLDPHYLRNPDSIEQKIQTLKEEADQYLGEHLYPLWNLERNNMEGLDKLLWIGSEPE